MAKPCECGAMLLMPFTEAGVQTPVADRPNPEGRVAVRKDGDNLRCRIVTDERPLRRGEVLYMSHFAECRHADKYRKKEAAKKDRSMPRRPRGASGVPTGQGTLI